MMSVYSGYLMTSSSLLPFDIGCRVDMHNCDVTMNVLLRYRRNNGCRIEMAMKMSTIAIDSSALLLLLRFVRQIFKFERRGSV